MGKARARFVRILIVMALLSVPRIACADTIVLLTDPRATGLAARVRAELELAGFEVTVRPAETAVDPRSLGDEARATGAVASIRVHAASGGVELWIIDRVTGKTVLREIGPDQPLDDDTIATKTTELLRASLLEVRVPGFRAAEVPVPRAAEAMLPPPPAAPSPPPRGFVTVGAGALYAGDLGLFPTANAELRVRIRSGLAVALGLLAPLSTTTLSQAEGTSSQSVSTARASIDFRPRGEGVAVAPFVGVTTGLVWLHASGSASAAPYTSQTADVFAALAGLRAGLAVRMTSLLALRAQLEGALSLPSLSVHYAGRSVASLGPLLPGAMLGVELSAW